MIYDYERKKNKLIKKTKKNFFGWFLWDLNLWLLAQINNHKRLAKAACGDIYLFKNGLLSL